MTIVKFKDGQMAQTDRIVSLHKWQHGETDELFVCVETLAANINFFCSSEDEQNDMLLTLSKQLSVYLNPVELVDLDFSSEIEKQKIN